jgi:alkylhydroperoxidase family enzyme
MPRLRQVDRAEATSPVVLGMYDYIFGERDPVAEPGTEDGTTGDWWTVFALSPDILEHAVAGFLLYQDPRRQLDPVLRELGQCRVGWVVGSQFVFSQHCRALRSLGVSDEKIKAVAAGPSARCFNEIERLVLAFCDALAGDHGRVADEVFDPLRQALGDVAMLELTYISGLYLAHAVMSRALRTEFDDRPDPVVEVPGPEVV